MGWEGLWQWLRLLLCFASSNPRREQEKALRREEPPETFAGRLIKLGGLEPTSESKKQLGRAIHWGYSAAWVALYGVLRRRAPVVSKAVGLPFGILFFLIGDELMNGLMGLTPPPRRYPIEAHVRGLAGHLLFAAAAEGTIGAARATFR